MIHLVFLAPYEELSGMIEQVFSELSSEEPVSHEVMTDFFNNTLEAAAHGDAIISRGFTALTLRRMNLPYAELKTTGYDVVAAVGQCLRENPGCKKLAIVGAFNMVYGSESIGGLFQGLEIASYTTHNELMLRELTEQAISDGAQAIVGGCSTVALAREYGLPGSLIESGKEAIRSAIYDAIRTVRLTRAERKKRIEVENILNYSFQGILSTDQDGIITLANDYCGGLLRGGAQGLVGKPIRDFFPTVRFDAVLGHGEKLLSEIHRVEDTALMVNCVPIEAREGSLGCVLTFQNVSQIQQEEEKIRKRIYKKGFVAKYRFSDICAADPHTFETIRIAEQFSHSDSNLLITGESGVGKELFAQSVHNASARKNGPFVAINCAALPEELLESELFGYVEGAFTGAARGGKTGLFEIAHRGTVFLDEIGDISPKLQGRLLRVLQEREILRLGHDEVIPIDVRVVSATNKNLHEQVRQGVFREDLLYRLDVLRLNVPPLRERPADVGCLIETFLAQEREHAGCALQELDPAASALARSYDWPGNVRELRNFCERLGVLCRAQTASAADCAAALGLPSCPTPTPAANPFAQGERELIAAALHRNEGNRKRTAEALGIDPSTLWRKMKRLGL